MYVWLFDMGLGGGLFECPFCVVVKRGIVRELTKTAGQDSELRGTLDYVFPPTILYTLCSLVALEIQLP